MSRLELLDDLIRRATTNGADAADAICFQSKDVNLSVRLGELESIERSESDGFGLRVFVGKKTAIVSGSDARPQLLDELAERAVSMARHAPEDPHISLSEASLWPKEIQDLDLYDTTAMDESALEAFARKTEEAALSVKGITNSEGADIGYGTSTLALATSKGFAQEHHSSSYGASISVLAGEGVNMERDYDYSSATHAEDLASPESLGAKAAKLTLGRLNPQAMRTGKMPVVFDPRVARRIVGYFLSGINGASVARGTSFLRDAMKTQIFAPGITIHMDPFRKRGLASSPFDAEGVAHQAMNLIEDGMLTTWLLDLRSAHQLGLKTNGCASRGLTSAPSPSAQNVHLEAGRLSPEELMADIKDGVYITETFGTGVNLTTGDFSQGAAGIRIENGKLTYPVSEFTIAGHLKDMFASLTPANDLAFLHSLNAPTLRVGEMMVAGQ